MRQGANATVIRGVASAAPAGKHLACHEPPFFSRSAAQRRSPAVESFRCSDQARIEPPARLGTRPPARTATVPEVVDDLCARSIERPIEMRPPQMTPSVWCWALLSLTEDPRQPENLEVMGPGAQHRQPDAALASVGQASKRP